MRCGILRAGHSFRFWENAIVLENHYAMRGLRRPQPWHQTVIFYPRAVYEHFHYPQPRVPMKMAAVQLTAQGWSRGDVAEGLGCDEATVRS